MALAWLLVMPGRAVAQPAAEYRAFWVDTFGTALNNHADVVALVDRAEAAGANAAFVQMRRRGDAWYLDSLEPPPDGVPIEPGFDPLGDLLTEAHARGIEVHAFLVIGPIWNQSPIVFPPSDPNHVFNLHGFNQATGSFHEGRDNWLTRTLLPDEGPISMDGHRFGAQFFVDLGHPDAAAYTLDVVMHLLSSYDVDGVHLDYIRYPEISIPGQTPATGANVGYNATNIGRFQQRHDMPEGSPPPAPNDPLWSQWRRDQVSQFVRRLYLNAIAVKPHLKMSAALIAFGAGPTMEEQWASAEAFWRVYQDWRAWMEEGMLDLGIPMNYKTEHTPAGRLWFDQWTEWTKDHQYGRWVLIGEGVYLNAIEGTLRQTRRALAPSGAGNQAQGVVFFSMAQTNEAVPANPFSIPPGEDTPRRPFAEFAAALRTGRATDGMRFYEDPDEHPVPLFAKPAAIPVMPWKLDPQVGHLMGFVTDETGAVVDAGDVIVWPAVRDARGPAEGRTTVVTATDGGGFYGGVDLAPGLYRVTVIPPGQPAFTSDETIEVVAGQVATFDVAVGTGTQGPTPFFWRALTARF